jgi:hypothetical protein
MQSLAATNVRVSTSCVCVTSRCTRVSNTAQAEPNTGNDVVDAGLVDDVEGGGVVKIARYIVEEMEEDEEEEEVLPLVRCKRCSSQSDTLGLVASARMVDIQGLYMLDVDCILEEAIAKALLHEFPEINVLMFA